MTDYLNGLVWENISLPIYESKRVRTKKTMMYSGIDFRVA